MIAGKEVLVGTISPANSTHDVPAILNVTLGTKMKLVQSYKGFQDIKLAIESKEVEGICGGWDGFLLVLPELMETGVVKTLVSLGPLTADAQTFPFFKDVPVAESFAKTDEDKQLIRLMNGPAQMSKPFTAGPGVPSERVEALRRAVAQAYADPEFQAEAKRAKLFASFTPGEEVQTIVRDLLDTPPNLLEKLKDALK